MFPALFTGMLRDGAHPNGSSGMSAASSQWGRVEATSPRGWQQLLGLSLPIQRSVTALGQAPGGGNTRPDKLQSRQELGFNCLSKRVSPRGEVFIERWSHVSSAFHGCNRHFISVLLQQHASQEYDSVRGNPSRHRGGTASLKAPPERPACAELLKLQLNKMCFFPSR